jgi:predicted alpha/beta superfamily hydrolase
MTDYVLHRQGPFEIPHVGARHVRVYAPPRGRAHHGPAPVLFMFDGQNVFDDAPSYAGGWHLHKTARGLATKYGRAPVIIGVEHGGAARIEELSPWPHTRAPAARTDALVDWIADTLAPRLHAELHLSSEPRDVAIGGSSMGGLAALYAHFKRPDRFGMALAMSPSLWVGRGQIFAFIAAQPKPWASRIYLDAGGLEAGGSVLRATAALAEALGARGWDEGSLKLVQAKRGAHNERAWRRRAPGALKWLFAPGAKEKKRSRR